MSRTQTSAFIGILAGIFGGIVVFAKEQPKALPAGHDYVAEVGTPVPAQPCDPHCPAYEPCCNMPEPPQPVPCCPVQCLQQCGNCPKCPIVEEPAVAPPTECPKPAPPIPAPGTFISDLDVPMPPGTFQYGIPPFNSSEVPAKQAAPAIAYKVRMESAGEVTRLELLRGDDVALRVQCERVDVQMPAGGIQAIGKVCVSAPGIDVRCNRMWIGWQNGDIAMEGQVRILCQTGIINVSTDGKQQCTDITADAINCRLSQVGTGLDFRKPAPADSK